MKICKNIFGHRLECLGNFLDFYIVFSFLDKCCFPGASKDVFSGFRIAIYRYNFSYFYKDLDTTVCPAIRVLNKERVMKQLYVQTEELHTNEVAKALARQSRTSAAPPPRRRRHRKGEKREEEEGNGRVVGFAVNQRGLMTIYRWAFPLEHAGSDWIRAHLLCLSSEKEKKRFI